MNFVLAGIAVVIAAETCAYFKRKRIVQMLEDSQPRRSPKRWCKAERVGDISRVVDV